MNTAKRHTSRLLSLAMVFSGSAWALPYGAQVIQGQAAIEAGPRQLTITNSPNAIIEWRGFSIGRDELTRFVQQSRDSAVLNRVTGQDPSQILGQLLSNGRVYLINPNGIIFGRDAIIDTNGLIASTLNLSNQDFLNGRLNFEGGPGAGAIENHGLIRTGKDGNILLIAPNIKNSGLIESSGGRLILAAGESVHITSLDDPHIQFEVQAPEHEVINLGQLIANGGSVDVFAGTITNAGTISADAVEVDAAGNIRLVASQNLTLEEESRVSASATGGKGGAIRLQAERVRQSGELHASSRQGEGGAITIQASDGYAQGADIRANGRTGGDIAIDAGHVSLAGRIDARGDQGQGGVIDIHSDTLILQNVHSQLEASGAAGGQIRLIAEQQITSSASVSVEGDTGPGGEIDISAPATKLLSAQLNADGATGGGRIRVGGEYQGGRDLATDELPNAQTLAVSLGTNISANATETGEGGAVILWSDQESVLFPNVTATSANGDGGLIELSGQETLTWGGMANTGPGGEVRLDPKNITIEDAATASSIQYNLTLGYNYVNSSGFTSNSLEEGDSFGSSVSLSGTQLAVGAAGDGSGAVYLFSDPFGAPSLSGLIGKGYTGSGNFDVIALDPGDEFGSSVSLSGSQLAVGAVYDDGQGNAVDASGAVYLFSDPFGTARLSGLIGQGYTGAGDFDVSALENGDSFGSSVSLFGSQLAVGARSDDGQGNVVNDSGAVYLFSDPFGVPSLSGLIGKGYTGTGDFDVSDLEASDFFGWSLSLSASQLAIAAFQDDGQGNAVTNSGAVYLFSDPFGSTRLSGLIGAGYTGAGNFDVTALEGHEYFGFSVSLSGSQLAVGAPFNPDQGNASDTSGAVYLFSDPFGATRLSGLIGKGYTGAGDLDVSGLENGDFFGSSVSLSGNQLAVGAINDDGQGNTCNNCGTVYLFSDPFGVPSLSGLIGKGYTGTGNFDVSALELYDRFGMSVSLAGNQLAVGAMNDDGLGNAGFDDYGAVYLFTDPFGAPSLSGLIGKGYTGAGNFDVSALEFYDGFGISVSLSGNQLAVGAAWDNGQGNAVDESGAVYLFSDPFGVPSLSGIIGKGYTSSGDFDVSALNLYDHFGISVSLSGNQLAVGANGNDSGAVYLFSDPFGTASLSGLIGKGYTGSGNFDVSALEDGDGFGTSVSLSGNQLAVGAAWDNGQGNAVDEAGAVYLFSDPFGAASLSGIIGKGYTGSGNFDVSALEDGDEFGRSVSLSGSQLAVGAALDDGQDNVATSGAVYLFSDPFGTTSLSGLIGKGYTGSGNFDVSALDPVDGFGASVSLSGSQLAVGADLDDGLGNAVADSGAVYLFTLSTRTGDPATGQTFANNPSGDSHITPASITAILGTGTALTLQANNDIRVNDAISVDAGGSGGDFTLQAGRSLFIDADILTDNGHFLGQANTPSALGTLEAHRDPGTAVIAMAPGTTINTGSGDLELLLYDVEIYEPVGSNLSRLLDPSILEQSSFDLTLANLTTTSGALSVTVPNNMNFIGDIASSGPVSLVAGGYIGIDGAITFAGRSTTLNSMGIEVTGGSSLRLTGGTHTLADGLLVTGGGHLAVSAGTMALAGTVTVDDGTALVVESSGVLDGGASGSLATVGTGEVLWDGGELDGNLSNTGTLRNINGGSRLLDTSVLTNTGTLALSQSLSVEGRLLNQGLLEIQGPQTMTLGNEAQLINQAGATIDLQAGSQIITQGYLTEGGFISGMLDNQANARLQGRGTLDVFSFTNSGILAAGSWDMEGPLTGTLTINGDLILTPTSVIETKIAGPTACTEYDQIIVDGAVILAGTYNVTHIEDYAPTGGETFVPITFTDGPVDSAFDTVNTPDGFPYEIAYDSHDVTLKVLSTARPPALPEGVTPSIVEIARSFDQSPLLGGSTGLPNQQQAELMKNTLQSQEPPSASATGDEQTDDCR